jgi:hypothetical protein
MDSLEELPVSDQPSQLNEHHKAIMQKYLGAAKSSDYSVLTDPSKWKLIGCLIIIFIVLANPFIQKLYGHVPYFGGSNLTEFIFITLIFVVLVVIAVMYF